MSVDWAELYGILYEDVFRFLHSRVWDEERAHDLAQETFARALDHAPENPRAWLFSVAANLARDEARTAVRRKKHLALLEGETKVEPAALPEGPSRVERGERTAAVRAALERLGERDREVLLLWSAGLSYEEIAGQTGLAVGGIGTTLSRARKRLVEAYEEGENEDVARNRG